MIEVNADLWALDVDVRCVTTNGTVREDGSNVMGGGCAREAAQRWPTLPYIYGTLIKAFGNHVYWPGSIVTVNRPFALILFPVKHTVEENADLELILRSCVELRRLADIYGWQTIALPRPGCGLGGLRWGDVGSAIEALLDDRFLIVDFPKPAGAFLAGEKLTDEPDWTI